MKILLVNDFLSEVGGAETYVKNLGLLLKENNHDVNYFGLNLQPYFLENYQYSNYFPEYKRLSESSIVEKVIKFKNFFYNKNNAKRFEKFLNIINPDIVHCSSVIKYLTPSILEVCKKRNIPVVMTVHGSRLNCPTEKLLLSNKKYCSNSLCAKGNAIYCIKNKCKGNSLLANLMVASEFMFRKIHKLYDIPKFYICPSQALANNLMLTGVNESKIKVIPNFITKQMLETQPNYSNKNYLLYVGRLIKGKGIEILLQALTYLDKKIDVHIVGKGDYEKELKQLAEKLNLPNVKFLGAKYNEELKQEYKHCIATILPATGFEVFGITIIESFVHGKPVISSDKGGIPEVNENNITGLIFEDNDAKKLAAKIDYIVMNPEFVIKGGKKGRKKVENLYNDENHYFNIINIYQASIKKV